MTVTLYIGDVFEEIRKVPDHSIEFCCCSPPFLALRSYLPEWHPQKDREIGSEATPADWLDVLLELTAEFRRILTPWGSIAVELGDTYAGSGGAGGDYQPDGLRDGQQRFDGSARRNRPPQGIPGIVSPGGPTGSGNGQARAGDGWPLEQSLCGIPDAYALSLEYGWNVLRRNAPDSPAGKWRVRNKKAYIRSNPPVGALGRKERPATSYITVACLRTDRFFDLDAVRTTPSAKRQRFLSHNYGRGGDPDSFDERPPELEPTNRTAPGGAPPLDWEHDIDNNIDWTLTHPVTPPNYDPGGVSESSRPQAVCSTGSVGSTSDTPTTSQRTIRCWWCNRDRWDDNKPCPYCGSPPARTDWTLTRPQAQAIDRAIDHELAQRAGKTAHRRTAKDVDSVDRTGKSADRGGNWASMPELGETNGSVGARGWHIRRALQAAGHLPPDQDTYDISPTGYSGAHYAVWSPELARRLIDEMAPKRVCTTCGRPSERITATLTLDSYRASDRPQTQRAVALADAAGLTDEHIAAIRAFGTSDAGKATTINNGAGKNTDEVKRLAGEAKAVLGGYFREFVQTTTASRSSTWSDCGHNTWRPGRICDPFAGSGTTLAVANNMGRDATGIDIDQNAYGMLVGRLGPMIAALELKVHWPEPNWAIGTLPVGGGDYAEWHHQIGDQRTAITERLAAGLASFLSGVPTRAPEPVPVALRTSRPVVEVPGQGVLL